MREWYLRRSLHPPELVSYSLALVSILIATLLRAALDPVLGDHLPYTTYFIAVIGVAWYSGLGASLLATGLGAFAASYAFIPPRGEFIAIAGAENQLGMLLYFGVCCAIIFFSEAQRRVQIQLHLVREGLEHSEAEFRNLFELSAVGMVQVDADTRRFVRVNQRFTQITGYSQEELLRLSFDDITYPDDRPADIERFQRLVRGESDRLLSEKR